MKLSILSILLYATLIIAAPRSPPQRRSFANRATRPLRRVSAPGTSTSNITNSFGASGTSNVEYSDNWAGAVLTAPPSGATFNSVSCQFIVPTACAPSSGGSSSYAASIWTGIDGDTYANSILQAGIDLYVTSSSPNGGGNMQYSYDSWYEWYPETAVMFSSSDFSFTAEDSIAITIKSSSSTTGTVTLDNLTTGKSKTQAVSAANQQYALGGQNAEWIVEDFASGGDLVPFANFGTVRFTNAVAGASNGETESSANADVIDLRDEEGRVLTSASVSGDEVTIIYTG